MQHLLTQYLLRKERARARGKKNKKNKKDKKEEEEGKEEEKEEEERKEGKEGGEEEGRDTDTIHSTHLVITMAAFLSSHEFFILIPRWERITQEESIEIRDR